MLAQHSAVLSQSYENQQCGSFHIKKKLSPRNTFNLTNSVKNSDEQMLTANNWNTSSPHTNDTRVSSNVYLPSAPSSLSPTLNLRGSSISPRGEIFSNNPFNLANSNNINNINTPNLIHNSISPIGTSAKQPPLCQSNCISSTKKIKFEIQTEECYDNNNNDDDVPLFNFKEIQGKYEIQDRLGSGTFSNVFKATPCSHLRNSKPEFVALKRIHPTCSPQRILAEMNFLRQLGGTCHVPELLGGLRYEDQITLVLPYFEHDKFKELLMNITIDQIRIYMKSLFESLAHLNRYGVIHRDIKPGNFLFNSQTNQAMLVDFGLSEWIEHKNSRKPAKAQRAGTRGFRAPEVLLKYPFQTGAIDVWSSGIILLSFLTKRYPFFSSPDDLTSLCEIGALCGTRQLSAFAHKLKRRLTLPKEYPKQDLRTLSTILAPREDPFPDSIFDLFEDLMELDPSQRITAENALISPFILGK